MVATCDKTGSKKVYGIDLGTTYSAIAVVDGANNATIIPNTEGDRITASAVFFEPTDEYGKPNVIVGKTAKENANTDPDHFVDFVKPHMGSPEWKREIEGIEWTPEMISAQILKKLVKGVEQAGEKVEDVVITCPAYFNDAQHRAVLSAGQIAGLNVLAIINEPTAAALHYGLNNTTGGQTAVVYDLGGGTFDVTVVKIVGNNIEVVCSDGNHKLGGKDWDAKVAQYLAEKFAEENGVSADDLLNDPETATELRIGAEIVKQTLTVRPKAMRKVWYNDISSRIEIDRETFDALTKWLLDETEALTEKMMALAVEKGVTKFDEFLLVGGSTRMLQVREMVKRVFGPRIVNEPRMQDVDEAVAKGAAIYGSLIGTNANSERPGFRLSGLIDPIPPEAPNKILCVGLDVCVKNEANKTIARFGDFLARGDELPIMEKSILFSGPLPLADGGLYVSLIASLAHGTEEVARIFIGVPKPTIKTDFDIWVKVGISETGELTMRVGDNNYKSVFKSVLPLDEGRYLKESADHSWPGVLEVE